jgi:hypothetical protein
MVESNVLLGILLGEIDVMGWPAEMHGARHACVSVRDVKSTRIADIPIWIKLDDIQIWLMYIGIGNARYIVAHRCSISASNGCGWWSAVRWCHVGCSGKKLTNLGVPDAGLETAPHVHCVTASAFPRMPMSTSTASKLVNAMTFVAHIKPHYIQMCNDLMHTLMHQILLGGNVFHLVVIALAASGHSG